MKKNKIIIGVSTLLIAVLIVTGCGKEIPVKNGSKVAVSVKGNKITATEYYDEIKKAGIGSLINMIDTSILSKKYKENDEENEYIKNQIEQIKQYYGSDDDTYKAVIKQYYGTDDEQEVKEKIRLNYRRTKAVEEYVESTIKDDEIQKYYNENIFGEIRASHILITVDVKENATDEEKEEANKKALEKAKKVIKELKSGKSFKTLAKKYSEDKSNSSNGGDLGYFQLSEMVEEFSNAVKELKKNEYTKEPIKTEYGYHIILKTDEKNKAKLEDVKDSIKSTLRTQKLDNDTTLYYKSLISIREDNKIKWNDDVLKKAYDDYMQELIKSAQENS
ncbi:MAG: peptidylprolyl isomerase [Bacilli bacterium]|nr:peptidylprolyl isomerase [Bacilli bacterium]